MIAAIFEWTNTIGPGIAILSAIIIAATAIQTARITAKTKAADTWRSEAEAERSAKERLLALAQERERALDQQKEQIAQLTSTIETIGGHKVYEAVQKLDTESAARTTKAVAGMTSLLEGQERRAEQRHGQLIEMFSGVIQLFKNERDAQNG